MVKDEYPSDLEVDETTDIPVEGEEDFHVIEGPTWIDDGILLVKIRSGGNVYSETYEHTVTERIE